MDNKETMKYWAKIADNKPTEKSVKVNPINDYSEYDANFISNYVNKHTNLLDLASGSGLIVNKIQPLVKSITAVEKFSQFSDYITKATNVTVINDDILQYSTTQYFDVITLFGVVQYFSEKEVSGLYNKCRKLLVKNGKTIIKNQFGVSEKVVVSGYSDELKTEYFSEYRHVEKEILLLYDSGFSCVEKIDIYPPECNRWANTHFYALVAS